MARRIREALARYADEEWRGIEVKVDGSTVTLLGRHAFDFFGLQRGHGLRLIEPAVTHLASVV